MRGLGLGAIEPHLLHPPLGQAEDHCRGVDESIGIQERPAVGERHDALMEGVVGGEPGVHVEFVCGSGPRRVPEPAQFADAVLRDLAHGLRRDA